MAGFSRRSALGALGSGAVGLAAAPDALNAQPTAPHAFAGKHVAKPMSFDPTKLTGLSEKLIRSHFENNYMGSIKALNMIEGRLATAMADKDLPPIVYGGLKREELHRTGSVTLHELYFGALGGDGIAAGNIKDALARSHGSYEAWDAEFRRTAMAIAGGSGWVILAYNLHSGSLHNYWAWDHMHQPAASVPLLTLDMYEHAFHMDYGAAAAKYVDAFMHNLKWEVIDARFARIKVFAAGI